TNKFKDKNYKSLYESNNGQTRTYKNLASSIDSKAYQAVGSAMAKNPYFIVVP
ncbi:MAG: MGMT family protein, partial [Bacilli bacterium]